jgi:hypothetical protein
VHDRGAREAVLYLVKAVDNLSRALTITRGEHRGLSDPQVAAEAALAECRKNLEAAINALNKLHV